MSTHGYALEQKAWEDRGSPTHSKHVCPHCGTTWTTLSRTGSTYTSPDGHGTRADRETTVTEGTPCGCEARIAKEREDEEWRQRHAAALAKEEAERAAFEALPRCRPDDARRIEVVTDFDTGDTEIMTVAEYLRQTPEARYADNRERTTPRPGVKGHPSGWVWLFV
jgi:hypothetical protein